MKRKNSVYSVPWWRRRRGLLCLLGGILLIVSAQLILWRYYADDISSVPLGPWNSEAYAPQAELAFTQALEYSEVVAGRIPGTQDLEKARTSLSKHSNYAPLLICVFPGLGCPEYCYNHWNQLPDSQEFEVRNCQFSDLENGPLSSNMLLISRTEPWVKVNYVEKLSKIVLSWRQNPKHKDVFVGILIQADELNEHGNSIYLGVFDYALRNYYFPSLKSAPNIKLRALGNATCGKVPELPNFDSWESRIQSSWMGLEPRLGLFWIPPPAKHDIPDLPPGQLLRSSQREFDCCFIGSLRADRKVMVDEMRRAQSVLNCKIIVERSFGGSQGVFEYGFETMGRCAIALLPKGNNQETIRFMDALKFGAIPLVARDPATPFIYFDQFFMNPPIFTIDDWVEAPALVLHAMKNRRQLDQMQSRLLSWYHKLLECQKSDMQRILSEVSM